MTVRYSHSQVSGRGCVCHPELTGSHPERSEGSAVPWFQSHSSLTPVQTMTFRTAISVILVATACSSGGKQQGTGNKSDSAAGAVTSQTVDPGTKLPANHNGRIPVLEYHVIGGAKNAQYTRTAESFKADLEDVYKRGYRPITIAQMLDKNFSDVPDGMSPVVFVFDDASPEQFRYVEQAGQLQIDPTSGMGIWQEFAKTHPGWKNRATFCLLNG